MVAIILSSTIPANIIMNQIEEQHANYVSEAYMKLINREFTGVLETDATIEGTRTIRRVIRVTSPPEVIAIMNSILRMDSDRPVEAVWKAITRSGFNDIDGIRLWCNDRSTVGVADGEQRDYRITRTTRVNLQPSEDYTYKCIMDVHVETV